MGGYMNSSVAVEFQGCEFGDKRLTTRLMKFSNTIRESPQTSINAACGSFDQSKAAYRFLQNEKITPKKILDPHVTQTLERMKECKNPIIIIQDTTTLTYSFPTIKNLGTKVKLKGFKHGVKGVELHTSLAVNFEGVPLGILKQNFFTQKEEVESIHVADRECDIYEFLHTAHEKKLNYVVRSNANRRLYSGARRVKFNTIEKNLSSVPAV